MEMGGADIDMLSGHDGGLRLEQVAGCGRLDGWRGKSAASMQRTAKQFKLRAWGIKLEVKV